MSSRSVQLTQQRWHWCLCVFLQTSKSTTLCFHFQVWGGQRSGCALRLSIENMTCQLQLASFMLQADCGYCSHYRPHDKSTTCEEMCVARASILTCFYLFHCYFFSVLFLYIELHPMFCSFYRCLLLSFSYWAAQMHTHLSVICVRWFLMHLRPGGSSHSNLHQHPLPWLFVCVSRAHARTA